MDQLVLNYRKTKTSEQPDEDVEKNLIKTNRLRL